MTGEGGATTTPVAKPSPGTAGGAPASTDGGIAGVPFAGPLKRSVTIAGHPTSISLEPVFWHALRREAESLNLPLNALVARIDAERIEAADPPNLASAIRIWLFERK